MPVESFTTTLILTVPAAFIVAEYFSSFIFDDFVLYSLSSTYTETVTFSGSISFPSSSVFLVYPVIEDTLPDLSSDCFDITLDQVNIYVLENDGIIEQSEDEKRHKYEEYKKTVLECIDKGLGFNYEEIVNDDLRNDEDFILKLEKSLKKDEDIEWAEDIREQIGIKDKIDPTKESQDFKDEIVDMTRDGFSVNVDSLNQMSKNIEDLVLTESKEDRKQRE